MYRIIQNQENIEKCLLTKFIIINEDTRYISYVFITFYNYELFHWTNSIIVIFDCDKRWKKIWNERHFKQSLLLRKIVIQNRLNKSFLKQSLIFCEKFSESFQRNFKWLSLKILKQIWIKIAINDINNLDDRLFLLITTDKESSEEHSQQDASGNEKRSAISFAY